MFEKIVTRVSGFNWAVIAKAALVAAALALLWFLVVSPRMEVADLQQQQLTDSLKQVENKLIVIDAGVKAQAVVNAEKAAATDEAAAVRTVRIESTRIIREAAHARAEASGDPEVSDDMDAFLSDIAKEQTK